MYVVLDNKDAARAEHNRILDRAHWHEMFSMLGTVCPNAKLTDLGFRMLVCAGCLQFYKVIENECLIMRVVHGERDYQKLLGGLSDEAE